MNHEGARNIVFVGHTGQGGRGDGVQVMVTNGHAYVGTRVSRGVMVTDVRDPRHPKPLHFPLLLLESNCLQSLKLGRKSIPDKGHQIPILVFQDVHGSPLPESFEMEPHWNHRRRMVHHRQHVK